MTGRLRRNHGAVFNAKVAVAAIKGEHTMIELAQEFDVPPNRIKQWRYQVPEDATEVFGEAPKADPVLSIGVKTLHAKIGDQGQWLRRWRMILRRTYAAPLGPRPE